MILNSHEKSLVCPNNLTICILTYSYNKPRFDVENRFREFSEYLLDFVHFGVILFVEMSFIIL